MNETVNSTSIISLISAMGVDVDSMEINKAYLPINKVEVMAYSVKKKMFVWEPVLACVKKPTTAGFRIATDSKRVLDCSGAHKVLVGETQEDLSFVEVSKLESNPNGLYIMTVNGLESFTVTSIGDIEIYDISVGDEHSYLSNGIVSHNTIYGSPETTPGGNALKFYASVRMDVRRKEIQKEGGEAVSNYVKISIKKNKTYIPLKDAELTLIYNVGIDKERDLIDAGVDAGVIEKRGGWLSYTDKETGVIYKENGAKAFFAAVQDILPTLNKEILDGAVADNSVG